MTDSLVKTGTSALSESELGALVGYGARASWPAGFTIYERGATADGIFIVLRGMVVLRSRVRAGRGFIPALVSAGQPFGVEGISTSARFATDARAETETDTLHLTAVRFRALAREQAPIAFALLAQVMDTQSHLLDRLRELATLSVEDRLLLTLLRLAQSRARQGDRGTVTLDSGHYRLLCELVGATRESVSLVMNRLIASGIAERASGGSVVISDLRQLAERAARASGLETESVLVAQGEGSASSH